MDFGIYPRKQLFVEGLLLETRSNITSLKHLQVFACLILKYYCLLLIIKNVAVVAQQQTHISANWVARRKSRFQEKVRYKVLFSSFKFVVLGAK
jgi:hypothetical protein